MNAYEKFTSAAERYDAVRRRSRDRSLPPGYPLPQPTADWPPENVALLERYREWLLTGGASPKQTHFLYIPMAGNALGLNPKPHPELNLDGDLARALDYVVAKGTSDEWIDMCRVALDKFRHFLRQERGLPEALPGSPDLSRQQVGLPDWLIEQLTRYQHLMQRNWRPARLASQIRRFWSGHARMWRWLVAERGVKELKDLKRAYVLDYVDHRLSAGYAISGINNDLRCLCGFLRFLQDQGHQIPQVLFRLPSLRQPDSLPKFLTDGQICLLRDDFEARVEQAGTPSLQRDALLDQAVFYLLWHGGLRLGEVEELELEDLDLANRRLVIRKGKGLRDRTVYLTTTAVEAVRAYLDARGLGRTNQLFLYRNEPVNKDLIRYRIKAAGKRVGVKAYPHRLRHSCATQLVNAGCPVTSIQKFLGHRRLNSTMVYARVHDRTVAEDYYAAMDVVEKRLELASPELADQDEPIGGESERGQLLELAEKLARPELSVDARLHLVDCLCRVLNSKTPPDEGPTTDTENGRQPRAPP